jgi:hypothetical protein
LCRSTSSVRAPVRAAAIAAAVPAGPPPATSTSTSSITGISRAGSTTVPRAARRLRRSACTLKISEV